MPNANITWDSFNGELFDGDLIDVSIEENVVGSNIVLFVLEAAPDISWWKAIQVPDGLGHSWEIWTQDSKKSDNVALWADQVNNGQLLEFKKAKLLGAHTGMYWLGGLGRLKPGTRVTFRWVQEKTPQREAKGINIELNAEWVYGVGYWVKPGQTFHAKITLRNDGDQWTPDARYKLGSQDPQDNMNWGLHRVDLPNPVPSGQNVTFEFDATAPTNQGWWSFSWRMVQEGVTWFGDSPTCRINVTEQKSSISEGDELSTIVTIEWHGARISCINKARRDDLMPIQYVGGIHPDGRPWKLSLRQAIAEVENGHGFYVEQPEGDRVEVVVAVSRFGHKYLKTVADGDDPNNLLALPECL